MARRPPRVTALALAFLLAGCAVQVAAPRDASPTVFTAKPSPTNATNDLLYVSAAGSAFDARVRVVDARTGSAIRELPGGVVSRDGSTLYSTDYMSGGTKTQVRLTDLVSGRELRSFTIDGAFRTMFEGFVPVGPSADGRWLVLTHDPFKIDDDYITQYAVVDTISGASTSLELRHAWPYGFVALSPDGKRLYLVDNSNSAQPVGMRAYDLTTGKLRASIVPGSDWNLSQANGWRSSAVASTDGRWLFTVNTSATETPFVMALDTIGDRAERIPFPADQKAALEKAMMWSLVATKDGDTLYAVNPAVGAVNDIDTRAMSVRRTGRVSVRRATDVDVRAAIQQAVFSTANAKRLLRSAAVLSLDERTLYAAGESGLAVIDVGTLAARTWHKDWAFDLIAMSPDGAHLYALANDAWNTIAVLDTRDGAILGGIRLPWYPNAIVRVDLGR